MNAVLPVEIVGGGLAGLSAALALARGGVPVTVFEAGDYPRHRVCGEFIAGLDEPTVERLGLRPFLADARPHRTATFHVRGRALRPFPLPSPAWGISRRTLDARLAGALVSAGGRLRTGTRVGEDDAPPGRVFAVGKRRRGPFWVGLKVHARNLPLASDFELHLGDRAYVGLSHVETGAVNVCGIFAQRGLSERGAGLLAAYLDACGLRGLARRLREADADDASFCVTAAHLGDHRVAPADRVRLGDACASIAPFTGNGLAMALQGAAMAVGPLRAYAREGADWGDSVRAVAAAQRRRFRRRLLLASALHPFFTRPGLQELFAALVRCRLVPLRALYGALH